VGCAVRPPEGVPELEMGFSEFIARALPVELPVVAYVILLLSVALPAVWSRHAGRRRDALAVLRILVRLRDTGAALPPGPPGREDEALDVVRADGPRAVERAS
jgi:hypothetical protein